MIVSATVGDETVSIGEAKENPDELISVVVRRPDDEQPERVTMHVATFSAFAALANLYLDENAPGDEEG